MKTKGARARRLSQTHNKTEQRGPGGTQGSSRKQGKKHFSNFWTEPVGQTCASFSHCVNMKHFAHVTTSTEQGSTIIGRVDPTNVNVLVRDETKCPVDMLHGDTQSQLGLALQLLTGQPQRNFRACLHHLLANVGSMF